MRTLVVGDIHAKPQVLVEIDAAASAVGAERIVCLGDYLDPVWPPFEDEHANFDIFRRVVAWAERRGDVTLLLGNHEAGYLDAVRAAEEHPEYPEILTGPFEYAPAVREAIEGRRGLFAWATAAEGWLLTHAGVTLAGAEAAGIAAGLDAAAVADAVDTAGWVTLRDDPLGCHGEPEDLIADPYPVDQAVGHTAVETVRLFHAGVAPGSVAGAGDGGGLAAASGDGSAQGVRLCFCDTMSMCDSEGKRTGDSSYLLLDGGEVCLVRHAQTFAIAARDTWTEPEWPGF